MANHCPHCGLPEGKHVEHATPEERRAANISLKLDIKYNTYQFALERLTLAELETTATTLNQHKRPGWRWRLEYAIKLLKFRTTRIPTCWELILRDIYG